MTFTVIFVISNQQPAFKAQSIEYLQNTKIPNENFPLNHMTKTHKNAN